MKFTRVADRAFSDCEITGRNRVNTDVRPEAKLLLGCHRLALWRLTLLTRTRTMPPLQKSFAYLAVVSFICVTPTWAQRSDFEFALSGVLAEKLEPGTQLGFWNPSPAVHGAHFSLDDLPITLPFQQYAGHHWHVSFYEPKGRHTLFSVILSADLFDKPRAINLKFDWRAGFEW